jgi:hypothetical protein
MYAYLQDVVDAEGHEHEHDVAHVGPLDLGHRVLVQLVLETPHRVQAEALAWIYTQRAADMVVSARCLGGNGVVESRR